MVIREAIARVRHLYSKGVPSHELRLSNRYIYSKLRTSRIRVLSQEAKKRQAINEWSYQTIPCFPMIIAPSHECLCIPSDGCEILRTECKLPQIFTDNDRELIKSVSTIVGHKQFGQTTWMSVKDQSGRKYTKTKAEYYLHNGYLYLTNNKKLDVITIVALFNDPLEAATTCDFCDTVKDPCISYLDYDLHLDGKLEEAVCQLAAEEIIYIYAQMNQDRLNNAQDDTGAALQNPRSYRSVDRNDNRNISTN